MFLLLPVIMVTMGSINLGFNLIQLWLLFFPILESLIGNMLISILMLVFFFCYFTIKPIVSVKSLSNIRDGLDDNWVRALFVNGNEEK